MKYLLIVNPVAGNQKYQKKLEFVRNYFINKGHALDVIITEFRGHAEEAARKAIPLDYDAVIGAGGDGTIQEVLNGLAGSDKKMGILPWGTGNVFAHEMNYPASLRSLCRIIISGRYIRLDAGRCNKRLFLLMCGAGFDAYALKSVQNLSLKKTFGFFYYIISGMKAFTKYRYPAIEVDTGDGIKRKAAFALISNTSRYGAFFTITSRADPLDGILDVFIYEQPGRWNLIKLFLQMFLTAFHPTSLKRKKLFYKKEAHFRSKKVSLTSTEKILTQIDGEIFDALPVTIEIVPKVLNVILPAWTIRRYRKSPGVHSRVK